MPHDIARLEAVARRIRRNIVEMVYRAQSGHIGGALSIAETLTALYFGVMRVDPKHPDAPDRDRFVLSKGHTAPALYAALAEAGFFPREWLFESFREVGSRLQGHPCMTKTPGVDMSSGSLGVGLSTAGGMALAGRLQGLDYRVYCMIGDGELDEGQIWEAAATAAHHHLDRLTAVVDVNGLQNDGPTRDILDKGDVVAKWQAFGWHVVDIDGHDFPAILAALDEARATAGKPTAIVQRTTKGRGVSFMENIVAWHSKSPTEEEYRRAMAELADPA